MGARSLAAAWGAALAGCALWAAALAEPIIGREPQGVQNVMVAAPPGYTREAWVRGLNIPWSLVFLPEGGALVSERGGTIRRIDANGRVLDQPYAKVEGVHHAGEGGLMGLALHPEFPRQPYVYAMHTYLADGRVLNRVVRLRHEGQRGTLEGLIIDGIPGARFHNGGRIAFGPDGMLYVTTGDIFQARMAQDRAALGGKILRLTPDGAVPEDNPYPDSPVYSYGHRNPQGLAWHPQTGELFASEHGPSGEFGFGGWDEVNRIERGANHGWPLAVGAAGREGLVDPLVAWKPAVPPSGMTFHRGDLFVATLRSEALVRIRLARENDAWRVRGIERWFALGPTEGELGRIRDVVEGPDGALYLLTSNRDGRGRPQAGDDHIWRLMPAQQ